MTTISRRSFIKKTFIVGAAASMGPTILIPRTPAAWSPHTRVHPHINDLRVVGLSDSGMTRPIRPGSTWAEQETAVAVERVWENMDRIACTLADVSRAPDAWKTIFVKPPKKSWADTVVAIKTNNIAQQHTRSAVISKICHTLVNIQGIRSVNIHIYDGVHGATMATSTPFAGLPEGVRIEGRWGGPSQKTSIPAPWKGSGGTSECLRPLVDGSVDLLVNISMCKGHSVQYGGFTMTMKNHLGTFAPSPIHTNQGLEYLIAINKTPEILGTMDNRTGTVLFPRQQLCIVDALWASKGGPGGCPSHQPNFLAMGVFSPVVDYYIATTFRGRMMGWEPNLDATLQIIEDFGYSPRDLAAAGGLVLL